MFKMQKIGLICAACLLLAAPAGATRRSGTGTVARIRSHDSTQYGPTFDWFTVSGVTSLGSCRLISSLVLIKLRDDERGDRQFELLSSALQSGKTVTVYVDDSVRDANNYCLLRYVDIAP